jgi:hypothetical protein
MKANNRYFAAYFMTVAIASALIGISAAESRPDERNEEMVLGFLRPALLTANKAGRLYYVVPCKESDHNFPMPFPEIRVQSPLSDRGGLEAVREVFRDEKRVTVSEESDGIIKVHVGQVPAAILQTKIPLLRLSQLQRYDEKQAVLALVESKAVQSAMRKLGLQEPPILYNLPLNLPLKTAPHLPVVIRGVTLDQALDMIAKKFGVIVVFGECTSGAGASFMRIHTVSLHAD